MNRQSDELRVPAVLLLGAALGLVLWGAALGYAAHCMAELFNWL